MGQYREWRYYREIDLQLQMQLARLEHDLTNLQNQAHNLAAHDYSAQNSIVQTLQQQMLSKAKITAPLPDISPIHNSSVPEQHIATTNPAAHPPQALPSLASRNRDANPNIPTRTSALKVSTLSPVSSAHDSAPVRQPKAIDLLNASEQADTRVERLSRPINKTLPVDQQSKRTNEVILRWFERWGKQQQNTLDIQEDAHDE